MSTTPTTTSKKATPSIDECLNEPVISLATLRRIASLGISDDARGLAWRVLLGFLPVHSSEWTDVLQEKRSLYSDLVHQVFSSPTDNGSELVGHHGKQQAAQHRLQVLQEEKRLQAEQDIDDVVLGVKQVGLSTQTTNEQQRSNDEQLSCNETSTAVVDSNETTMTTDDTKQPQDEDAIPKPITRDGSVQCVPVRIREQWKRSGRDSNVLVEMSNATGNNVYGMNTLLVVDNQGMAVPHDNHGDDRDAHDDDHDDDDDKWTMFYENAALLDEIRKDVVRTHPDLKFFLEPTQNLGHRRYAAMERILFVWAKLNRGVSVSLLLFCNTITTLCD